MVSPTPEQQQIIDAFQTGENLVIEAGAGTGKTSTLRMMAAATTRKGIYIAYNRAIADDAKASFPSNVQCSTAHSLAFRSHGVKMKHRLNGPRVNARQTAGILGITQPFEINDETTLAPDQVARMVMDAVARFCNSDDSEPSRKHVPFIPGAEDRMNDLATVIVPLAIKAWADLSSPNGRLRFTHDCYLKMWALDNPRLNAEFILLDEAQDANPVIAGVVARQQAQQIMVGDRSQAIYGWRGAVDAMADFNGQRLMLSQSFRFGQAIADEANRWLGMLDAPLRLSGFDQIDSKLETLPTPDAILCRTNAEAISQALSYQEQGKTVAIVGGTAQILAFTEAASDLMSGHGTGHPDLMAFRSWSDVQHYVANEEGGADLKVMVRLIDSYGVTTVLQVARNAVNENRADIIISTAHKAKGREWNTVRIAGDFKPSDSDKEMSRSEMMLAYVAVTRAKLILDNEGLAWV